MSFLVPVLEVIFFAVLVMVLAVPAEKLKDGVSGGGKVDHYYLREALFTPAERSFLGVLEPQLPPGVRVFGKVRLEDLFGMKSGLERGPRQGAWNRIGRKHVDFLLFRSSDLTPLAGIELDDSSHEAEDRKARDCFIGEVFLSCDLPLLHVPAQAAYNPAELRSKIAAVLSRRDEVNQAKEALQSPRDIESPSNLTLT